MGTTNGTAKAAPKSKPKAAAKAAPKTPDFEWPQDGGTALILDYLRENVSADADAPNKGLPFITESGLLRIRAEHWRNWLAAKGMEPSKLESARPIREGLGYSMKPFAIPGENFSHGFYTGPAPKGTEELPRRIIARAASSAPKAPKAGPFGRMDAETLGLLKSAVTNYPKRAGGELRERILAELEQASEAHAAAAAKSDAAASSNGPSAEEIAAAAAIAK